MKAAALALIAAALLPACTSPAVITAGNVTVRTSGRLGGQGGLYVREGNTEIATYDNNEDSFREGAKTARFGIGAAQAASVIKSGISAVASVKNTTTAAGVSKAAGAETTKQAAIAAEREAARLAAAESALVLPPTPVALP